MDKVIISAAITGAVHTPSMSPYLPITPEQLADEAVAACEAGAAIVHNPGMAYSTPTHLVRKSRSSESFRTWTTETRPK